MEARGRLAALRQDCPAIPGRVLRQSVAVDLQICSILEGIVPARAKRGTQEVLAPGGDRCRGAGDDPNLGDWFL